MQCWLERKGFYWARWESKEGESNWCYWKHSHWENTVFGGLLHLNDHWKANSLPTILTIKSQLSVLSQCRRDAQIRYPRVGSHHTPAVLQPKIFSGDIVSFEQSTGRGVPWRSAGSCLGCVQDGERRCHGVITQHSNTEQPSQCLLLAIITNQLFPLVSWKGCEHRLAKDCHHHGMTSHHCFKGSCAEHRRHCLTCPATPSYGCRNEKRSPGASSHKLVKAGENPLKSQRPPFKCACRSISLSIKCFWTPIKQSTGGAGMALNNLCTRWCLHAKCTKSHTSYSNLYFFVHLQ